MRNWRSRLNVENLRRPVAAGRHKSTVKTEAHTADHALMGKIVDEVHVKDAPSAGIKHRVPVISFLLEVVWQLIELNVGQDVGLTQRHIIVGD
jgi:hypothetical protein